MIIKSFTGESTKAAMKLVRSEMGGQAVVLKTRQVKENNGAARVEITACIEHPTISQAASILKEQTVNKNRLSADVTIQNTNQDTSSLSDKRKIKEPAHRMQTKKQNDKVKGIKSAKENLIATEKVTENVPISKEVSSGKTDQLSRVEKKLDRLLRMNLVLPGGPTLARKFIPIVSILRDADLPEEFIANFFISCCDKYDTNENIMEFTRRELAVALAEIMIPSLSFKNGDKVMFLGYAGVGKSSVMGKLAAQLVTQRKQKVKLSGLDFQKVAAFEELAIYADLLNLEIAKTDQEDNEDAVILIDTPAIPTNLEKRSVLEKLIGKANATHRIVVFSTLTRTPDITSLARQLKPLAPTHIAFTMLDMTYRWGAVVAVARELGVPVAFLSDSSGGVGPIGVPDPDRFARTILNNEVLL
ncbi:MAG: hypothetical protein DRP47_00615 [Candidatus Zixiibacteriota bacterium]|nr:MAG: hypothetical protein DRP47_00615 [candidate division Zixibacteria bacterium]